MPIGGFVVNIVPEEKEKVLAAFEEVKALTVYGHDDEGHLIVVLENESSEEMEKLVRRLLQIEGVLSFDLAYLHGEDEVEKIEAGEFKPKIRFHRFRPEDAS